MTLPGRFVRLSRASRWLLMEAITLLAVVRLAIALLPFRWIAPHLGAYMVETPERAPVRSGLDREGAIRSVAWAVETAARHVPWKAVCLPQAVVAKLMLRRRGVGSTLYLGAVGGKSASARLHTHAWLRADDTVVTGAGIPCAIVASFA